MIPTVTPALPFAVDAHLSAEVNALLPQINAGVPRAKPPCPKCRGTGHYYEPPEAQQRQEIAAGKREFTVGRTCECIREGLEGGCAAALR